MRSFYDGSTTDRTLVTCPRCLLPSDPIIGHGAGDEWGCDPPKRQPKTENVPKGRQAKSPAVLVREWAFTHQVMSMNTMRGYFTAHGYSSDQGRGGLMAAVNSGWIEKTGYEPSTDPATKGHPIAVYHSLCLKRAVA